VVDSQKRQASSGHVERFRECGSDFLCFLTRKRKVDSQVVEAVLDELLDTPLAETDELQKRVNARLGRSDLSWWNIKVALEQIKENTEKADSQRQSPLSGGRTTERHYEQYVLL
jgi:hypothetical protein